MTIPIRLLSSVAVVGRDNEPIYLRGDLCDASLHRDDARTRVDDDDDNVDGPHRGADAVESPPHSKQRTGLLGRIMMKGVVVVPNEKGTDDGDAASAEKDDDDDDDDDDPFGFFTEQNAPSSMSLTQQLVLHASLDRFEEMTVRSGSNGGRWRMPGSSGPNAMWMGLLWEVEERWNVYGYLTNTGIKFMIIVENVLLDEEGVRHNEHASSSLSSTSSFVDPIPSSSSAATNREADLKRIFSHLHELYVRYTLNPFSKLRSTIRSRVFDEGITDMAYSFNEKALKTLWEEERMDSGLEESLSWM